MTAKRREAMAAPEMRASATMRRSEDAFTTVAGDKSVGKEYASGMTATREDFVPLKSDRVVGGRRGGGRGGGMRPQRCRGTPDTSRKQARVTRASQAQAKLPRNDLLCASLHSAAKLAIRPTTFLLLHTRAFDTYTMSRSRDRVEDTYELQNDERLEDLHSKLRTLRGVRFRSSSKRSPTHETTSQVTTDIYDDVERQNTTLDESVGLACSHFPYAYGS